MDKKDDALKLALEALEGLEALLLSFGLTHLIVYGDAEKAITNLQEALAEPSQQQEPVGTVQCINGVTIGYLDVMQPVGTKLYTSPPAQRTWVGLTESEKSAALYDKEGMTLDYEDYAEAIEAKLKENNI